MGYGYQPIELSILIILFCSKEIDNDLFGNARTRSEVFWERYDLLLQVNDY